MFNKKPLDKYEYSFTGLDLQAVEEFLHAHDSFNPFEDKINIELENKGLREIYLFYNPDYIYYTVRTLLNIELYPLQCMVLECLFKYPFPMIIGSRGFSKSYLMAVYLLLRCILFPGTKAVVAGAAFRQSKYVYEYIKTIWENAPILQSIYKGKQPYKQLPDIWRFILGSSEIAFIPVGTGDKIRGLRANILAVDEFNSVNLEIYEVVLSQFTSVSMSPMVNLKEIAKRKAMRADGLILPEQETSLSYFNNQSIISGTLKFSFDPLAIYWKKYKDLIESKGEKLQEIFGDMGKNLDWKDFAIIRIPYECIPEGFMDEKVVARARATMHTDFYQAEYGCVPISDTSGFFKRSLIESCTAKEQNVIGENWPAWCHKAFEGKIRGDKQFKYVIGIDPASEQDNFSIVVLELWGEHQRVVYCWTTNKENFKKFSSSGDDKNYYAFCVKKIRSLMREFGDIVGIGCDSQGGGYAIEEGLHDIDKLGPGEIPIWPIIEEKEKDTDSYAGFHILHMVNFSSSEWTTNSNHGMKKDMQDKLLLFPQFNAVLLGLASEKDMEELKSESLLEDNLESCMLEIESLKDELSMITRIRTVAGRERWDTPEIKVGRTKKDKLRKDRYSALLIANSVARTIHRAPPEVEYNAIGAAVGSVNRDIKSNKMYIGPDWYTNSISPRMFVGVQRGVI